jgi:Tfp pilus assembly protein PilO
MTVVKDARRQFVVILVVLLILDAACLAVLFSPIGESASKRQEHTRALFQELEAKTRETVPLERIDQKVADARKQIDQFYEIRFPSQYSSIADELGKLADQNGVKVSNIHYKADPTSLPDLQRITMEASLSGDYLNEVRFINALERSKLFFLVDNITLGEQTGGSVALALQLETYLRNKS